MILYHHASQWFDGFAGTCGDGGDGACQGSGRGRTTFPPSAPYIHGGVSNNICKRMVFIQKVRCTIAEPLTRIYMSSNNSQSKANNLLTIGNVQAAIFLDLEPTRGF